MQNYTGPSIMDLAIQHSNYTNPPMGNFKDQEALADNYRIKTTAYPYNQTTTNTVKSIVKIRPKAEICDYYGNNGWRDEIRYRCPVCDRIIGLYREATACDKCGTFYDWGKEPARIVITKSVQWD